MIVIFSGLPGAGKSLKLAMTAIDTLYRNRKLHEKKGLAKRPLLSNIKFSKEVEEEFGLDDKGYIKYWADPAELVQMRDCDVVWDEIATHLDSTQWANMSLELKRWLQQHRKYGVEIYGTTQDFAQIDKSMRRLTSDLLLLTKVFGSPDPSPTRPSVTRAWGIVLIRTLDPQKYDEEKSKFEAYGMLPKVMLISTKWVNVFNTRQEILMGKYPPMRHIERSCERPDCIFVKTVHA